MRTLLRFLMLRRLLDESRRHRRRGTWGHGYGRHRPSYGWGYGHRRPRGRSRVHVTGCCLPIPLGMLLGAGGLARLMFARRRL